MDAREKKEEAGLLMKKWKKLYLRKSNREN
jgi:hypothetical protein